jgi:outer membrane lipoprotein-sorting protein
MARACRLPRPAALLLLRVATVALLLSFTCLASAESAWKDIWNSESVAKQLSIEGDLQTRALIGQHEQSATAAVRAANGKLRLDYQAGRRKWSLIDDGSKLIRLSPERQTAFAFPRPSLATDSALAQRNYVARAVGEAEVAGRPVKIVEVSRPHGPVAWRVWLDREYGFALKRERYNVDGRLVSGTEYTAIRFGVPVSSDVFEIPKDWKLVDENGGGRRYRVGDLSRQVGFEVATPRYLPQGYVLQGGYVERRGRHGRVAAELRYTDGLRLLSISQRMKGEGDDDRRGGSRHRGGRGEGRGGERGAGERGGRGGRGGGERGGGRHGWGFGPPQGEAMTVIDRGSEKAVRYFGKDRVIVIVGDLPRDELVRVATSLD